MNSAVFPLRDYDLAATLTSGQAFRWTSHGNGWVGIVHGHWVRLESKGTELKLETTSPVGDWDWLRHYLQLDLELESILATFPADEPLTLALAACRGLRLLRQEPWECLASFILSSTKQIVQIQQIIKLLCERYGEPLVVPAGHAPAFAFPTAAKIAALSEAELRACKMGFRAPYLLAAARAITEGRLALATIADLPLAQAREAMIQLPGVGLKIADCVLLFAYGFPGAFPVDVWVMKALKELYFPRRRPSPERLKKFIATYFGPHPGYAQQYLFHYMRKHAPRKTT